MLDRVTYPRLTTNTHEKAIMQKYFLREKLFATIFLMEAIKYRTKYMKQFEEYERLLFWCLILKNIRAALFWKKPFPNDFTKRTPGK